MFLLKVENAVFFLIILFLPTQLGLHFWPRFSFIYSLPIDYLSPTIYFWDLLVLTLFVILILRKRLMFGMAFNLLLFFLLTQAVSLMGSVNVGAGLVRLEQYIIVGMFGLYLASQRWENIRKAIFWGLVLGISFESILAIAQFIKGGTIGFWILGERTFTISTPAISKFDFHGSLFLRPYGTFPHPNVLSAFLVIGTILLIAELKRTHIYGMVLIVLAILAIILTLSRVAIAAGVLAFYIQFKRKARFFLVFLLLIIFPILYTRYVSLLNFDNLAILRREELGQIAFNLYRSSPLIGVGLNNFIQVSSSGIVSGPSRFLQPVHNIFLLSLSETGILGLSGFIGLIGYPILRFITLWRKRYSLHYVLIAWGVLILLGFFDHFFLTIPQGYRLVFLIWGISLSVLKFDYAKSF